MQLKTVRQLAQYWQKSYDWRKIKARLNTFPQFVTAIDGLEIQFIHVLSKHANALPMIVTHGWPGPIIEQIKIIEPLTNPTAHGDRFDLVIPSLPGHGFFRKAKRTRMDPASHCARVANPDAAQTGEHFLGLNLTSFDPKATSVDLDQRHQRAAASL